MEGPSEGFEDISPEVYGYAILLLTQEPQTNAWFDLSRCILTGHDTG
jgi:hypothetical protein